jgi:hypothetical protein
LYLPASARPAKFSHVCVAPCVSLVEQLKSDRATHSGCLVAEQGDGDVAVVGLEQDSVRFARAGGRASASGGGS